MIKTRLPVFNPNVIRYDGRTYLFHERLGCIVDFEEDTFLISQDELGITVWGETLKEAKTAFNFTIDALFKNYAFEDDGKLSDKSKLLKIKLLSLLKTYTDETTQSERHTESLVEEGL